MGIAGADAQIDYPNSPSYQLRSSILVLCLEILMGNSHIVMFNDEQVFIEFR